MKVITAILAIICSTVVSAAPLLENRGFDYSSDKVRGVNLGGWLVLEPWITPSLWDQWATASNPPLDEYSLCEQLGDGAQSFMESHWSSWYTEADFAKIASAGLNTVRIPIGYWAFHKNDGDPYVQGQVEYLDKAIGWARNHGLNVWVDLHGAPGSQNGFDNSGKRGDIGWQQGDTIDQTLAVLKTISQKYGSSKYTDVVSAVELLNEPLGPMLDMDKLTQFYKDGFGQLRDNGETTMAMSDAFKDPSSWNGVLTGDSRNNVVIDHHHYQVFSADQVATSPSDQVGVACAHAGSISGSDKWVVTGEFSSAMTDCAKWLNGYGRGSRYEGQYDNSGYVGSCDKLKSPISQWSQDDKTNTRKYIEAQLDTFETQAGWIYWCWKTEGSYEWDMEAQIDAKLFPQPLTSRTYPNQCS